MTVGHIHDHLTDLQGINHVDQVHNPAGQEENHIPRNNMRVKIEDPPTELLQLQQSLQ